MILNKVIWMTIVGAVLQVLRVFLPDLPVPEGIEEAIVLIITFITGFFVRESEAKVARLDLKE